MQATTASPADDTVSCQCVQRRANGADRSRRAARYRWQYIVSGAQHPHFGKLLTGLVRPAQMARIQQALAPLVA